MGELTTIAKASSNFASLRTVIPMSIVKQWNLKEGDKLDWSWEARNNEMLVAVRKIKLERLHKDKEKAKKQRQVGGNP